MNKYALLSVSDKTDIVKFAQKLTNLGWKIISTGGTYKKLSSENIKAIPIEEITGNPEILDGRVKTLSFQISAGLLFRRDNNEDIKQIEKFNIPHIDLVCCNLYPFKETIEKKNISLEEAIENIDIGGPTMIRCAAKNYNYVTVVTDPTDYDKITEEIAKTGETSLKTREALAVKAFDITADYDAMIDKYLSKTLSNNLKLRLKYTEGEKLRYGENSHQKAKIFKLEVEKEATIPHSEKLWGKELSFNNYVDGNAAIEAIKPLKDIKAVCIVKHNNPCGYATGSTLIEALKAAWEGDPVSAFGSVIAMTKKVDLMTAEFLQDKFVEIIIAPGFDDDALEFLKAKSKNLRLLRMLNFEKNLHHSKTFKHIIGGMLQQDRDIMSYEKWEDSTKTKLPADKEKLAKFSFLSVQFVKSNAVVISQEYKPGFFRTLAIGAGQPNRINALQNLAIPKALENLKLLNFSEEDSLKELSKCILSSDAFFPFRDTVDCSAKYGLKYIIQPGGSIRDKESINACNEHNISMIFTGTRHFNH